VTLSLTWIITDRTASRVLRQLDAPARVPVVPPKALVYAVAWPSATDARASSVGGA